jgi:hypothetical protein
MNYVLCRHRVRNFDYWKGVFDSQADAHCAAGLKLVHLWHEADNPRQVFFLFELENVERARSFLDSSVAAESASKSGLIEGDFHYFNESLGYGLPDKSPETAEDATPTNDATSPSNKEAVNGPVSPEPTKGPEPEKNPSLSVAAEPTNSSTPTPPPPISGPAHEKSPALSATAERASSSTSPPTMKGPERVNSATPPHELPDGWEPVENWPPAMAAAEAAHEESSPRRGRWTRRKY